VVQFEFQRGKYTSVRYARFADDLLILIDSHPRRDWLKAVEKRIREEMAKCHGARIGWRCKADAGRSDG
jgi:hypothetical protein